MVYDSRNKGPLMRNIGQQHINWAVFGLKKYVWPETQWNQSSRRRSSTQYIPCTRVSSHALCCFCSGSCTLRLCTASPGASPWQRPQSSACSEPHSPACGSLQINTSVLVSKQSAYDHRQPLTAVPHACSRGAANSFLVNPTYGCNKA